jgi:transcriptional regulator with XRE-family HTH domain
MPCQFKPYDTLFIREPLLMLSGMGTAADFGFGLRLKEARLKAGISMAELGKNAGDAGKDASRQSVNDWEKGRHYPKADQIRIICLRLGVSADQLIFGDLVPTIALAKAANAVQELTPEQRSDLLRLMLGPNAVSDHHVEKHLPPAPKRSKA